MKECYRCGITDSETELYEAVHPQGRVFVCRDCYSKFRMPLIDNKKVDWSSFEPQESVRERLSRMAHVKNNSGSGLTKVKNPEDVTLRDIIEKNFEKNKLSKEEYPGEIVDNFHWVIMRKRRGLKLSQEEFAEKLVLPLKVVQSIERGILPKDYKVILKRIENVLGIRLFKGENIKIKGEDILEEARNPRGILISDVEKPKSFWDFFRRKKKEDDFYDEATPVGEEENSVFLQEGDLDADIVIGKEKKEEKSSSDELFFEQKSYKEEPRQNRQEGKKGNASNKEDLSSSEIDDIIWGRK